MPFARETIQGQYRVLADRRAVYQNAANAMTLEIEHLQLDCTHPAKKLFGGGAQEVTADCPDCGKVW